MLKKCISLLLSLLLWLSLLPGQALAADEPIPVDPPVIEEPAEPEEPQSRWTGITEELVTSGPAPLTAEAVSLAFQRDGRRYDNGFPLY